MSKSQWNKPAFMDKSGPHTVRMGRRGDMEVRPEHALDATYFKLHERADEVRRLLSTVEQEIAKHGHSDFRWKQLIKRKKQLEAELQALRVNQQETYLPRYEAEFLRVARLILDDETLQAIDNTVISQVGQPPRHWNTFLGKRGYGWVDRSQYK